MSQKRLELPPVSHRCPKCRKVFHEAFTCQGCGVPAVSIDVWRHRGDWLVSGGIRVNVDPDEEELVLRYQEDNFFTQVRLPFEELSGVLERAGFVIVPRAEGSL